ncbi:hypothetical protein ACLBWX_21670 [Methylobacterium sp. M6A4_1b]
MRGTAPGLALLLAAGGAAAEPVARSGIYDSLTLAVSGCRRPTSPW